MRGAFERNRRTKIYLGTNVRELVQEVNEMDSHTNKIKKTTDVLRIDEQVSLMSKSISRA